jgi:hypothetical protein
LEEPQPFGLAEDRLRVDAADALVEVRVDDRVVVFGPNVGIEAVDEGLAAASLPLTRRSSTRCSIFSGCCS